MPSDHRWIDISVGLYGGMPHWPGDPEVEIERFQALADGDAANVTRLAMSAHTGTHLDAPLHYLAQGAAIDAMPLEATLGPARVIALEGRGELVVPDLAGRGVRVGERLLLRTDNSRELAAGRREWAAGFVALSLDAARWLAAQGLRSVGIDGPSIGGARDATGEVHRALLEAGVWIIEGLDLSRVTEGSYELACLPLKLVGADGAPARAALRALAAVVPPLGL